MGGPGSGRKKGGSKKSIPDGILKEKTNKKKTFTVQLTKERGGYYTKTYLHPNGRGHSSSVLDHHKYHKTQAEAMKEYKKQLSSI
jgi:hypothetical protein